LTCNRNVLYLYQQNRVEHKLNLPFYMKNREQLTIESFLLMNGGTVVIEYFFAEDKEFTTIEIPLTLFNLWLLHYHYEFRQKFSFEGEISWIDMFYDSIPSNIQKDYIMHWEKCKELNEQEAA
jgi:hypothetical protein